MTTKSLHQVMNELVQKPIAIPEWTAREDPHSERDVYLKIDPLLADLFKSWQSAEKQYKKLKKKHGLDDPMVLIAADMADSCESAYETRLIELKRKKHLQAQIRRLVLKARLRAERERQNQSAIFRAHQFMFAMQRHQEAQKTRKKQQQEAFLFFIIWLFCFAFRQMQGTAWLAADFTRASHTSNTSTSNTSGDKAAA